MATQDEAGISPAEPESTSTRTATAAAPITRVAGKRVRALRDSTGMTGARLAQRLGELGIPWTRSTIAKFEKGDRQSISVQELLALALALDVPPVVLLADPRVQDEVPVAEGKDGQGAITEPAWDALLWLTGCLPLTRQTPMGRAAPPNQGPDEIENLSVAMRVTGPEAGQHRAAQQLISDAWTVVSCLRALDQQVVIMRRPDDNTQDVGRERDRYQDGRDYEILDQMADALRRIQVAGAAPPIISWRAKTRAAELGIKLPGMETED